MPRPKGPPPTLPAHAEDFLRDVCNNPRTESTYRTVLISLQRFAEATELSRANIPLPPRRLRAEILADYYTWLRRRRYSNASIRLYLAAAGQYLNWLEGDRKLPAGVRVAEMQASLKKKIGQRGQRVRPERRGSDDAVGALLTYYESELASHPPHPERERQRRLILLRNHALLYTLYATAGRASEIASLQRADVAEGSATQVEIVGKGGKKRVIILTASAQAAIRTYLNQRTDASPALFISHGPYKGDALATQTIWQIVNNAAKDVFGTDSKGRPLKRVGPHAFRHLRAQHLSDEGMPITSLQALLGHASIATTRDTYAPKTPSEKLVEEVATYGREPNDVVERGKAAIQQANMK